MRFTNWSTLPSSVLWDRWQAQYPSQLQAEAAAIWAANRLVKKAARSTRARFYDVKDAWLQRVQGCLVEGRIARVEQRVCRACDGAGDGEVPHPDVWCARCEGTGIWDERTLYLHMLDIEGTRYRFHSYTKPAHLVALPGEDLESYGGKFTEAEWQELSLPLSGLVRMLRWLCLAMWAQEQPLSTAPGVRFTCHCAPWPHRQPGAHHELCRKRPGGFS